VHQAKGQWSTALDLLKKEALPLYNVAAECALGDRDSATSVCPNYQAATLINIGKIYYDTADYKSARCFYERALPLVTLKSFKAALFNNLGTIDYALGNYPEALVWFQEAMKLHADIASAEALTNTVLTQTKQEKDISLSYLEAALRLRHELGSPNAEAATRNSVAELYNKLARPKDALSSLEVAIPQFHSAGDLSGEATALSNAMISWRMLEDRKRALANGKQAVELFQTLRVEAHIVNGEIERTYLRTVRQAYENTAELLIEEGLPEQAIEVLSLYRDAQSISGKRESIVTSRLIAAQQSLAANPSLRAVTIYTLVGESKFHVLAVTRDGIKVFSRPLAASELQQKVEDFLAVLQCAERSPYQPAAALYDVIFKTKSISDQRTTLETFLKAQNAATLLWSLDHPLNAVPMAALYNATSKQFLVENYRTAVFTRGDPTLFAREPGPWLTGIGLGTSKQFGANEPIRGAEAALVAVFGDKAKRSGVLTGKVVVNENFTGKALEDLNGHWPLVYIFSHFVFDPGDSQASYLQLGNNTTYSLAQMRAQPDLFADVELLAIPICESASAAANRYGKEIEAFTDVAQQIGARSVIGSLWKVSYHVTPHFMQRFYELAAANPGSSKAELLREAQLDLLRGKISVPRDPEITRGKCGALFNSGPRFVASRKRPFAHPFYWSAFVLYGAPR
jgi:CHAT domain-containing protein